MRDRTWYGGSGRAAFTLAAVVTLVSALAAPARAVDPAMNRTPPLPDMLARVAPSVVKVRRGDVFGTGFVFQTPLLVVTSVALLDAPGDIFVVPADGIPRPARVAAWSKADGVALLELAAPLPAPPLQAAIEAPYAGEPLIALCQLYNPDDHLPKKQVWSVPVPAFGRVSRISATELNVDMLAPGLGCDGAPLVNPDGGVVGVWLDRWETTKRRGGAPIASAWTLLGERDRQGEFSPKRPFGFSGGLFMSPLGSRGLIGTGIYSAFWYDWFMFSATDAFFRSDHEPVGGDRFQSRDRVQFEMDTAVRFGAPREYVFVGPGLRVNFDTLNVIGPSAAVHVQSSDHSEVSARADLEFGILDGILLARGLVTLESAPEVRLDLGLVFGK